MPVGYYQNELRDMRGNALTAAVVDVFDVGTTNPATIFSDAAGTVPMTASPLPAAAGLNRPGKDTAANIAFFADDSVEYDVRVTQAGTGYTFRAKMEPGPIPPGTLVRVAGDTMTGPLNTPTTTTSTAPWVDVTHPSVAFDATGGTSNTAKVATAEAAGDDLFFPRGTYDFTTVTITKGVRFQRGAKIRPRAGQTVTIAGPVTAADYQIFDLSLGGTVTFSAAGPRACVPEWWGGVGDVVTTDNGPVAAALAAAGVSRGTVILRRRFGITTNAVVIPTGVTVLGRGGGLHDTVGNRVVAQFAANATDATVTGCLFTGSGILGTAGRGILSYGGGGNSRLLIHANRFERVGSCALSGNGLTKSIISNNIIIGGAEHGVYLSTGCADVLVQGNQIIDIGADGGVSGVNAIKLASASRITCLGNIITGGIADAILIDAGSDRCTVIGGAITEPANRCIRVIATASNSVINGVALTKTTGSLETIRDEGTNTTITTSTFVGTVNNAIFLGTSSSGAVVETNRFLSWAPAGYCIEVSGADASIRHNDIAAQSLGIRVNAAATNTVVERNRNRATTKLADTGTGTQSEFVVTTPVATASLPAASAAMNGRIVIEDAGAGDRNLIIYAGGQRFRIDGGANV